MEILTEQQIKNFLAIDVSYGNGDGNGDGYGYGSGDGYGYGSGDGYGYGYGSGDGYGYGYGNGDGYGNGNGSGIQKVDGYKLYDIDSVPTAIVSIRGNIAQGFILEKNIIRKPCYIVKENNRFAHGSTLHEAFAALQEKLYDDSTEEERIEAFKSKFPLFDAPYKNTDLFAYHHVLTGSCRMGRESFCKNHGINLDGKTTVREFVRLTHDSYGGDIISRLPQAYGITEITE